MQKYSYKKTYIVLLLHFIIYFRILQGQISLAESEVLTRDVFVFDGTFSNMGRQIMFLGPSSVQYLIRRKFDVVTTDEKLY